MITLLVNPNGPAFYRQVRHFLMNYTKENICPKFEKPVAASQEGASGINYPKDGSDINPDDIPF